MEKQSKNEDKTMKQKRPYIAPKIEIIPMEDNLMHISSGAVVDPETGEVEEKFDIIEGDIPDGEAKESPYSGYWEL